MEQFDYFYGIAVREVFGAVPVPHGHREEPHLGQFGIIIVPPVISSVGGGENQSTALVARNVCDIVSNFWLRSWRRWRWRRRGWRRRRWSRWIWCATLPSCLKNIQGDTEHWPKPPVDFKAKVPFWLGLARTGQAKAEPLFRSQREVLANVLYHPVYL